MYKNKKIKKCKGFAQLFLRSCKKLKKNEILF